MLINMKIDDGELTKINSKIDDIYKLTCKELIKIKCYTVPAIQLYIREYLDIYLKIIKDGQVDLQKIKKAGGNCKLQVDIATYFKDSDVKELNNSYKMIDLIEKYYMAVSNYLLSINKYAIPKSVDLTRKLVEEYLDNELVNKIDK